MLPRHKKLFLAGGFVILLGIILFVRSQNANAPNYDQSIDTQTAAFDKTKNSTETPGSLWWVVNKSRPVSADYIPSSLVTPNVAVRSDGEEGTVRSDVAKQLEAMFAAANQARAQLLMVSGYRSYTLQQQVYSGYVNSLGQAEADRVSAKPGTSEHQTGLSFDVGATNRQCELDVCFGTTPEGKWVAANAYKYGFIVRYPEGKESVTGYSYEPWHMRYVGKELAAEMRRTNTQTMEEFFKL